MLIPQDHEALRLSSMSRKSSQEVGWGWSEIAIYVMWREGMYYGGERKVGESSHVDDILLSSFLCHVLPYISYSTYSI